MGQSIGDDSRRALVRRLRRRELMKPLAAARRLLKPHGAIWVNIPDDTAAEIVVHLKRRGLTIDLGFAHTTLPSGAPVSFVDVPGHVRFLRNMLAGVGGDMMLLGVPDGAAARSRTGTWCSRRSRDSSRRPARPC